MNETFVALGVLVAAGLGYWFLIRPALKHKKVESDSREESGPSPCTETCEVIDREGPLIRHECEHETHQRFKIRLWGQIIASGDHEKPVPLCADCLLAKVMRDSIRCGLCGRAILPGESVALYVMDKKLFRRPHWITRVEDQVLGCLDWDCCQSRAFFAGHWTLKGFKPAFAHGTAIAEVFATGKSLVINFSDQDE